ncbi:arsenic transporter [Silvimonas soli]|uniref:arsenic transporter n=1 Tax=Silvimonas soli TaxID=2980100 RepID=UPI0024B39423|nr:arsenic transporter [Silvimonas soli]
MNQNWVIWSVSALATAGVILRPLRWPEAVWACGGAAIILLLGQMPWLAAWGAVSKGLDVYLFLTGMMLLSEVARREGLFDWVAVLAVNHARGSPTRLFLLVYLIGTVVTVFMSNDTTAVVLTPAVFAMARKANAPPLPLLFICAFIANAGSFVLPISNPANLVLYGNHLPPLLAWLSRFALPSLLSIAATLAALWWTQRHVLQGQCNANLAQEPLSTHGKIALAGLVVTAVTLLVVSALDMQLGLPTAILGALTAILVMLIQRASPWPLLKEISWGVLPLVAGLFVLVEALDRSSLIRTLAEWLNHAIGMSANAAAATAGLALALASNAINNLPAGLIASSTLALSHSPQQVVDAVLIGVDLGPNLSVTGSLATILWLSALRREGVTVTFWQFFKVGVLVMPPALLLAIAARLLLG